MNRNENCQQNFVCGAFKITRTIVEQNRNENRLNLSGRNFHFIEPDVFQDFSCLVDIDLSNNSINSLPANIFDHCFSLVSLCLDYNQIANIAGDEFSKAVQLSELSLSHNMIVSIGETYIRSKSLTFLNLSHNFIETINGLAFSSLPQLLNLNLSHNKIYQIIGSAFYANKNLQFLFLENNNLTELHECTLRAQEHLRILNLDNNPLRSLSNQLFVNKPNMISINVYENSIRHIEYNYLNLPENLIHLYLTIHFPVTFHMFAPLPFLETFKINLTAPDAFQFRENLEIGYFREKPNLTCFELSAVRFELEPELIINLSNKLVKFHLECTDINGSNQSNFNFYNQINNWPQLKKFSLVNFTQMQILNWNRRNRWNRDQVFGLEELCLRGAYFPKKMVSVEEKCEKLTTLDLSFCQIDLDTLTGLIFLKNLEKVNLQGIKIKKLLRSFFQYNPKLSSINLENCSISHIQRYTFAPFGHRLEYLNLRNNRLQVITRNMMMGINRNGTRVLLEFNPAFTSGNIENF